ncbi:protein POLLEN DEFECTIVE IN GUIDANCE 1, partial [Fagus crenata]
MFLATAKEESNVEVSSVAKSNGSMVSNKLETAESLDWKRLMAEDPNYLCSVDKSPLKYFMEEMANGNSLRSTTTIGNEKIQERVYDTIFCLPWRCDFKAVTGEKILDMVS